MTILTLRTLFILAMVLIGMLMLAEVVSPSVKVMFETAKVIKSTEPTRESELRK